MHGIERLMYERHRQFEMRCVCSLVVDLLMSAVWTLDGSCRSSLKEVEIGCGYCKSVIPLCEAYVESGDGNYTIHAGWREVCNHLLWRRRNVGNHSQYKEAAMRGDYCACVLGAGLPLRG